MKILIAAILVLSSACANAADNPQPTPALTSISALDVPRYMGTWYEIAKFPAWFQKKCVADTRAEYRLQPDGRAVKWTPESRQFFTQFKLHSV
jgi:apolipoprotein D and lipocalin family protein